MSNSQRLQSLIRDGKLYLSVEDALAMALENNLDIAVSRYGIPLAQADYFRTQGGGAARGVSGSAVSSALFAGAIGGGGEEERAGTGGAGGVTGGGGATSISSMGCCDPTVGFNFGWDRRTSPLKLHRAKRCSPGDHPEHWLLGVLRPRLHDRHQFCYRRQRLPAIH